MFRTNTFEGKLKRILALFALVPALVLAIVVYVHNSATHRQEVMAAAESAVNELAVSLAEINTRIRSTAQMLGVNESIIRTSRSLRLGMTMGEEWDAYHNLKELLSLLTSVDDAIESIRLYLPEGRLITRGRNTLFSFEDLPDAVIATDIVNGKYNSEWTLDGDEIVYGYRSVYSRMSSFVVTLTVSQPYIRNRIEKLGLDCAVQIRKGDLLLYTFGSDTHGIAFEKLAGDWQIVCAVSPGQFEKQGEMLYFVISLIIIYIIVFLLVSLISSLYAGHITQGLNELVQANVDLSRHRYNRIPVSSDLYELRTLQESHNNAVDAIQEFNKNIRLAEQERNRTETAMLHEQIKPHFLYNTLEGGRWLALSENAPKTAEFIETLSQYYKIGLSFGSQFITLQQELEHVSMYVDLMNMR